METEQQIDEQTDQHEQGTTPDESRKTILSAIADIEAAIQQMEETQAAIYDAADGMRQPTHEEIEALERRGVRSEAEEQRYRDLLADRRRCDVVGTQIQE